jgi:hypothetical protein
MFAQKIIRIQGVSELHNRRVKIGKDNQSKTESSNKFAKRRDSGEKA